MNEERQEMLFDLLAKKAIYGLDETEQRQIDELDQGTADMEFHSLEITAAAISMAGLDSHEPLPAHLRANIIANAVQHLIVTQNVAEGPWPPPAKVYESRDIFSPSPSPSRSIFGWLGWATAAVACMVLAANIFFTRFQPGTEQATVNPPVETPKVLTAAQMRDEFMRSTPKMTKATWAPGNVKEMKQVSGDVVWSDEKQEGYMLLKGLAHNDKSKETYQLWLYDKTQDKKTPIDGGVFDVTADGDVVIPIKAKLNTLGPSMFAITIEKPGGVVVSKAEKIAALAKVETQTG